MNARQIPVPAGSVPPPHRTLDRADDTVAGGGLSHVVLTQGTVFDATRRPLGLRLQALGVLPGVNASALVEDLRPFAAGLGQLTVLLTLPDGSLDERMLELPPPANLVLEVGLNAVARPGAGSLLANLLSRRWRLAFTMTPGAKVPSSLYDVFDHVLVQAGDAQRLDEVDARRRPRFIAHGAPTLIQAQNAFVGGAVGYLGWPMDDPVLREPRKLQSTQSVLMDVMRLIRADAPPAEVETALKRDPTLLFKLLKLVNTPAFGLPMEITSFQHAVLLLGYRKLMRWLVLLLSSANRDPNVAPLVHYSITRAFLLDALSPTVDRELQDDMFLLGAFSLLDRIGGIPFETLFQWVSLSAHLSDALLKRTGPLAPLLALCEAAETDAEATGTQLRRLLLSPSQFNAHLLDALTRANTLSADG
jgi:c-di-GMP phosphodiesterase